MTAMQTVGVTVDLWMSFGDSEPIRVGDVKLDIPAAFHMDGDTLTVGLVDNEGLERELKGIFHADALTDVDDEN